MSYNKSDMWIVCYAPSMISSNGIWQGDNPLDYSLPLFIVQVILIIFTTRVLVFLLKPFRQPRVIAEILGGVILGPSVLGRSTKFAETIFPLRSVMLVETMANVGLLYFLFLVGVEMDIAVVKRMSKRAAFSIALGSMIVPFLIGIPFAFLLHKSMDFVKLGTFILYLGVVLSDTSFPVLARVLAEVKLLNTEIGKIALSSALVSNMCAWVLLAFSIALAENATISLASIWEVVSCVLFVLVCVHVIKPILLRLVQKIPEGEPISDFFICSMLAGVMTCGFITDAIGLHSVFGAFVFGLIIPKGPLCMALIERLQDFVSGILLPLFLAISGLKTDIFAIHGADTWGILGLLILLACVGKIMGTILVCLYHKMPLHEGLTLGVLMNTKGVIEMIFINVGKDQKVLDEKSFAIMVIVSIVMTSVVVPAVKTIHKPGRRFTPYKRRTVEGTNRGGEFSVLVCVHTPRNVPTIINLLEASCPTRQSPIFAYVLHLVELTGRSSTALIAHTSRGSGCPGVNGTQAQADEIISAFGNFKQNVHFVSVSSMTAISPYATMHEDICGVAEDKRASLIIIPFHKQQTVDGEMEDSNPAFQTINKNVLENSPCSVGILIDRGLRSTIMAASQLTTNGVVVLFFGGPDDREALAYAWRMSDHPGIHLTVMRFVPGEAAFESPAPAPAPEESKSASSHSGERGFLRVLTERDREKEMDEEFLREFNARAMENNPSIEYVEKVVNHGEETVAAIRGIAGGHDLLIVGRGHGRESAATVGLSEWSECPELGTIGDLLASSDFAATNSVLVIQRYAPADEYEEEMMGSPEGRNGHYEELEYGYRVPPPGRGLEPQPQPQPQPAPVFQLPFGHY
ncbi:cation/H(+) antiporter 15-like [Andrographis paniculata]|uniref:cation/H(+) antiporter 15-like n=1 Tax=Andrographis paniculata TaxID=175694 RepID=UPI0021E82F01|nr:cation/H(+) antiporter 15-like [Andrographis paniculata]